MIIAFEGLDGSGKTTIAKMISSEFKMEYRSSYLEEMLNLDDINFFRMKKRINGCDNSIEIRSLLFLSSILYGYSNLKEDVCFDRNILSEYLFDGNESTEVFFDAVISKGYCPDLTIILYASDEERRKRIIKRNPNDSDLGKCSLGDEKYSKMIEFAERKKLNYVVISQDNLSLEEVYEKVKKIVTDYIISNKGKVKEK
jgi:thymidylate kinase